MSTVLVCSLFYLKDYNHKRRKSRHTQTYVKCSSSGFQSLKTIQLPEIAELPLCSVLMKILMAHFWHNSCNRFLNFALLFVLKDPMVFGFTCIARGRSPLDGDHQDYMQFGNHGNNSGHYSDKFFFFLIRSCKNEMNEIPSFFFSSLPSSHPCLL